MLGEQKDLDDKIELLEQQRIQLEKEKQRLSSEKEKFENEKEVCSPKYFQASIEKN